ncbi:DNA topoisomerase 1 [Engraulis encrasicolus]|uniref:DNA topoisomerase 1 n=1 Tax=Engraulis encrasicolus TaxID=184585 RepID=UPI002FD3B496
MSTDNGHKNHQMDTGARMNDSHKHKDKHREKEHKHKDHKKDKEREREKEKSKHSNSDHRDPSEKKPKDRDREREKEREKDKEKDRDREREKEKVKHKDDGQERHRDKEKEKRREEREKEKMKSHSGDVKIKKEKENGFASPLHIKSEPDDNGYHPVPKQEKHEKPVKRQKDDDESSYEPKKVKVKVEEVKEKRAKKRKYYDDYEDDDEEEDVKPKKKTKDKKLDTTAPGKKKGKKEKESEEKWKWWEEERATDGSKWRFLEHHGPVFAPPYDPLPGHVRFYYDGKPFKLSTGAEEVATFFGKMLDHEYTTKDAFRKNFFKDWRKEMTSDEKAKLTDLNKCDFSEMNDYFKAQSEARKQMSKDQKLKIKEENERILEQYGFCLMDNHRERIGNFRIEPPGLFRGRGNHPKMGMLKRRIRPEDIIINCSKDSKHPKPPAGTKWKEVRHDNKVTWLASWTENIQGSIKYIMLNPSSRIKGEKDWQKYETARRLKSCVNRIRNQYHDDWKSKEMRIRQRAVALYFIDKLALRAGNEKEEGETADTVGCCSLRVEHIQLFPEKDGQDYVVEFDFLGKDSIRYYNKMPVEKRVFKNLQLFMENKQPEDDLFDRLNTSILNKHLQELMDGLTAKVFRTYNASITLQQQLEQLTCADDNLPAKILSYNRANRAVAILCNHQRAPPKTFEKTMQNLQTKIDEKKKQLSNAKKELKSAKADAKGHRDDKSKKTLEMRKKQLARIEEQLMKLEVQATDREENKQIALGTSKLNYLDPRISVAWCKKYEIPIEKIYNKTQREKFAWAIDMADEDYEF